MTVDMWKFQMDRMRAEYVRRGIPWLVPEEERALTDYLTRHAGMG